MPPEYLFRRNAVTEALRGERRQLRQLWLQKDRRDRSNDLPVLAQGRGLPVKETSKGHLNNLAGDDSHQGVVLEAEAYPYSNPLEMLTLARQREEAPFLLILDLIQGPQNIGMLIRTAEACGVHGVIMQDRRAPDITPHVVAFSAGATEHVLIAKETNLVYTIQALKEEGVWVAGMDTGEDAVTLGKQDLDMPIALVVGHEGAGLRRLVRENCDFILQLPMRGKVESLNAAVSGSVGLYAAWQARGF